MGEISLSFDFDVLVRKYISLQEQNWQNFSSEELSSFLILKNIIKLQNLFLKYALRKIDEEKKINLHKTLMPFQMIVTAAENLRAGRNKDKSYKQIISTIKQVEEYTLKSMRGISLSDTQWLAIKEKTEVKLLKLLRTVVKSKKPLLDFKKIKVKLPADRKAVSLWGRESDLDFLFSTLIENAINSVEDKKGEIDVSVTQSDGAVKITCSDNGCGIEPDEIDQIFKPGFRGKGFKKLNTTGTGLGLSLARHITNAHGGHINVESTPGEGTTFEIVFPSYALGGKSDHD
jgi:signal transduction histidine kinase